MFGGRKQRISDHRKDIRFLLKSSSNERRIVLVRQRRQSRFSFVAFHNVLFYQSFLRRRVSIDSEVDVVRRVRSLDDTVYSGVSVVLTVDTTDCASEGECFVDVPHVADFLASSQARKVYCCSFSKAEPIHLQHLNHALGWPVHGVRTSKQCTTADCPPLIAHLHSYTGAIIGGVVAVFLVRFSCHKHFLCHVICTDSYVVSGLCRQSQTNSACETVETTWI